MIGWFVPHNVYPEKLNMGKSCVRFKKIEDIPLDVVADAVARAPVKEFLAVYEGAVTGKAAKKK